MINLDYTLRIVLAGSGIIGFVAGSLGSFAILRKQSLLGDAISHAALPGIAAAFLVTLSKNPFVLLSGAFVAGWIGSLFVTIIKRTTKLKEDAALGIILSVFFGFGIFLLTIIQKIPTSKQAGLETFLFGNASTLLRSDLFLMGSLGIVAILIMLLFWKEFKILVFDADYAKSLGFPIHKIEMVLTTIIVIAIVIGLQTVGVVLMSAMIIGPAVSARQWTEKLCVMVFLAGLIGLSAGVIGSLLSSSLARLPTGPTIVVVLSVFSGISLFFSPTRGLFSDWVRAFRNHRKVKVARVLADLHRLSQSHEDPHHPHHISSIKAINPSAVKRSLDELEMLFLARRVSDSEWSITDEGIKQAIILENQADGGILL